jgi:ATP-dependent helicase/nuclease subunit B
VTPENLHLAQAALEQLVNREAARTRDEFAPAIERVWEDGVAAVRADLREWLRLAALAEEGWTPWRFEYSFGLPTGHAGLDAEMQDPHSTEEPAALACGVRLRGKIDLVERNAAGHLRVTDHKTGKVRVKKGAVVEGGQALQPLLYALAARQLLGSPVECGRLYYCTMAGGFEERTVPLTPETEQVADEVARAIRLALERGFLPAAPAERACEFCDYRPVCGQDEERRVSRKGKRALKELVELRKLP